MRLLIFTKKMAKTKEELKEYKKQWLKNKCLEDPNYYKKLI